MEGISFDRITRNEITNMVCLKEASLNITQFV